MFLVAPHTTLYSAHVQSVPFARPHLDSLINTVRWITEHDYPPGGEA